MPNAAASLDADYGIRAPEQRRAASQTPRRKGKKATGSLRRAAFSRVPRYGAVALSALIGVGIIVNALMMQHGHHPAPLFGSGATGKPVAFRTESGRPEASKKDAPKPETPFPNAVAPIADTPSTDTPTRTPVHSAAPRPARGEDAIARLIGGSSTAAPVHKARPAGDKVAAARSAKSKGAQETHGKTGD